MILAVRESGAEACAVCFLFGYLNPAHEEAVAARLRAVLPEVHLSLSSAVQPEFREYERFSTTALNAYLQPVMVRYLARLGEALAARLPEAEVGINQSSGGLMSLARAAEVPIRTALSGPAAGAIGAVEVAAAAGMPDVITLDMGGTSADVALIRGGRAAIGFDRQVADFPIRLPMVDIHTVGAGGGSIAWFDRDGLLKVGPQSAGAVPGPACYGQGGVRADRDRCQPRARPARAERAAGRCDGARSRALRGLRWRRSRSAWASPWSAPRMACSAWSPPTWCGRSARSRSSAATTRGASR